MWFEKRRYPVYKSARLWSCPQETDRIGRRITYSDLISSHSECYSGTENSAGPPFQLNFC